jgi:hypothetical protein
MVESIRHPTTRGRSVSIGPQSAADAYETLAYRERKRRESISSNRSLKSKQSNVELASKDDDHSGRNAQTSGAQRSSTKANEKTVGEPELTQSPIEANSQLNDFEVSEVSEIDERAVFSQIVKPRVRYDVEVVTKLVVYSGKLNS